MRGAETDTRSDSVLERGMERLSNLVQGWSRAWERFWFEADGEPQMRFFRAGAGLLLFVFYAVRSLDLNLLYSEKGILPLEFLSEMQVATYRFSLFSIFPSDQALWVGNGLFLGSLLALAWGIWPRVWAFLALALHLSFLHRNPAGAYGVDLIAVFFLFYLGIGGNGRGSLGSMAFRLSQIQVCIIYGYSGLHKLKSAFWWQGEAIWHVVANHQLARWDFSWMASFPVVIVGATYLTILFEVYFPVLIWLRKTRTLMLLLGVLLHVGIGLTIQIPFFAALMVLTYAFFLTSAELAGVAGIAGKFLGSLIKNRKVACQSADRFIV